MNVANLLVPLIPRLIDGLSKKGIDRAHAEKTVHEVVAEVATAHDRVQDAALHELERRINELENRMADLEAE